jgi:hypothetical protein
MGADGSRDAEEKQQVMYLYHCESDSLKQSVFLIMNYKL